MKKRFMIWVFLMGAAALFLLRGTQAEAAAVSVPVQNYDSAQVTVHTKDDIVLQPVTDNLTDALGQLVSVVSWNYYDDNDDVVEMDGDGNFRAVSAGSSQIRVQGYDVYGSLVFSATCQITVVVDMTNVVLEKDNIKAYVCGSEGVFEQIRLLDPDGVNAATTDISYESSNSSMRIYCSLEENVLQIASYSEGSTILTVTVNGKTFQIKISVSRIEITKRSYVTSKGKKLKLRVKGTNDKPVWSSSKPKVAKVSKNGLVRFRRNGNAVITANLNGKRVGCAVCVISPKLVRVVKRAEKIGSTWKYSQAKRMQSGYYDCSSLVWKSYSLMGKTFGSPNYAPVAANLAVWCRDHGKVLTKSYTYAQIQKMKFRPGDLMFETGQNNHRYKGIYHVEMFTGYAVSYYDESGKPVLNELWAARPEGYYGGGGLMERP